MCHYDGRGVVLGNTTPRNKLEQQAVTADLKPVMLTLSVAQVDAMMPELVKSHQAAKVSFSINEMQP